MKQISKKSRSKINLKEKFVNKDNDKLYDVFEIEYDVQLAANIVRARLDAGLTQKELASKLKTKQPAIARAESGNRPASHELLKKMARVFSRRLSPPDFLDHVSNQLTQKNHTSISSPTPLSTFLYEAPNFKSGLAFSPTYATYR